MRFEVIIEPQARLDVLELALWWIENRPDTPELVEEEFEQVVAFLHKSPRSLKTLNATEISGLRRKLMPKTRNHVYYVVRSQTVHVLAVGGAIRKPPPEMQPK